MYSSSAVADVVEKLVDNGSNESQQGWRKGTVVVRARP